MKEIRVGRIVLGFSIVLVILIIARFRRVNSPHQLTKLPKVHLEDVTNTSINCEDFKGNVTYIQFVNSRVVTDIDMIVTVYSNWHDEDLLIVVITNDPEQFISRTNIDPNKILLVTKEYQKLKDTFSSTTREGDYFLFDSSGNLVDTNKSYIGYDKGVKIFLRQLLKNDHFKLTDFIDENNIKANPWLKQLERIIEIEKKDYYVISLFTAFCGTCESGSIINSLQEFHQRRKDSVHVMSILNNDYYHEDDIESLISQSKVTYPIKLADSELNQKWSDLINMYRDSEITNIVLLTDGSGNILNILHPKCDCFGSFFDFLYSL